MNLTGRFGDGVELQGLEFVNALPIEWRLVSEGSATTIGGRRFQNERHSLSTICRFLTAVERGALRQPVFRSRLAGSAAASSSCGCERRDLPGEIKRHFDRHRLIDELTR